MKKYLFFISLSCLMYSCSAQQKPNTFPVGDPELIDYAIYTQEDGVSRKMPKAAVRKHFAPKVIATPITSVPTATGNTSNLNCFVIDPNSDGWYIAMDGKARKFANQIQSISLSGNNLVLSKGGGTVTLPLANYTAGAGIAITNGTISNTGDPSATNELQTISLTGTNLALSQGGGTVSLAGLGQNMANTDLVANGNRTHNGAGFGLTLENYNKMFFLTAHGAQFYSGEGFTINSDGQNVINSQNSTNQIQAGVMGQDFSTLGQNRITGILGNTMVAHDGSNYIQSIQGDNTFTCDFGNNYINSDNAKNILTAKNGNNITTQTGNNNIESTTGSNMITSNITNAILTNEGENVMQTISGDNIIRNVNGGNIVLEGLGSTGHIRIYPPQSSTNFIDYTDKWLHSISPSGEVIWDNLPPAPAGGLQAVSVTSPLTGNGTPSSPITMPFISNFANSNLLFTNDRIHNLNQKYLVLQNATDISFGAVNNTFTASSLNKFSGPNNQLVSTAGGQNAMFATGANSKNYVKATGLGSKNRIETDVSATKPIGSVLQKKDEFNSTEYTDYAMPATVTAADNDKVMTYKSATNTMSLETPAGLALKPILKYMTNGPASATIGGIPQILKFNVAMFDDLANYNSNTGEITIPVGRYHVALNIKLDKVNNSASPDDNEIYVDVQNSGASNVTINNLGSLYKYIPNSIYANKSSIQYDCIWHVTTPAVLVMRIGSSQNGGLWTINNAQGQSWFTLEKI